MVGVAPRAFCLADTAYHSDRLRGFMRARGTDPVIPNKPARKRVHPFDPIRDKQRNPIEQTVGRLKDGRRIHTRYDKLPPTSLQPSRSLQSFRDGAD